MVVVNYLHQCVFLMVSQIQVKTCTQSAVGHGRPLRWCICIAVASRAAVTVALYVTKNKKKENHCSFTQLK